MEKLAKGLSDGAGHCKEGFRIEERGKTARVVDEHYEKVQLPRLLRLGLPIPNSPRARAWAETLPDGVRASVQFTNGDASKRVSHATPRRLSSPHFGSLQLLGPRRANPLKVKYRGVSLTVSNGDLMDDAGLFRETHLLWVDVNTRKLLGPQTAGGY